MKKSQTAQISKSSSDPSKNTNGHTNSYTAPSTVTSCSTASTLTIPSSTQGSAYDCPPMPRTEKEILSSPGLKAFTFNVLKSATRNFRPDSLIGEGGFGHVYKGWIDEQTFTATKRGFGMPVAVKRLKADCFQGHNEWLMEVDFLGKLEHPNIVKLIGFCTEGDNRLLVYEYMSKGSLENHLFRGGPQTLPWATRLDIAIGAARGIAFLHDSESQVIYRDVKSSNILLDSDYSVRLSDFGLAKAGPTGEKTHVSTRVVGTQGYAAPEYIATGRLTAMNDVYSFGVVLLELLSGNRAYMKSKSGQEHYLVDWANPFLTDRRNIFRIMDSKLEGKYPKRGAYGVATLALQCINSDARQRPRMSQVLEKLEQIRSLKKGLEVENETPLNGPIKSSKHQVSEKSFALPLPSPSLTLNGTANRAL